MRLAVFAAAIAACCLTLPASSQETQTWQVVDVGGGCKLIQFGAQFVSDDAQSVSWSGACGADGFATGAGMLTNEGRSGPDTAWRTEFQFEARRGRVSGNVRASYLMRSMAGPWEGAGDGQVDMDFGNYQSGCGPYDRQCNSAGGEALYASLAGGPNSPSVEVETAGGSGEAAQCERSEDETLTQFNDAFNGEQARHPLPPSAGARAQYQYSYALGTSGLRIIEPLRQCLGRYYAPNHATLIGMRDQGRTGCMQLSTTVQCEPDFPKEGE